MNTYKDKYTNPDTGITVYITGRPIGAYTSAKELYDIFDEELESRNLTEGMLLNTIHNEWSGGYGIVVDTGETIFAFTDPQGIEQLYYTTNTYPFTIETSLSDFKKSSIDNQYISEICKWGYNTDNRTPWENIKRIMPGKLLVYNHGDIVEISIFEKYFTDYHPTKSLKELIEISVLKQLAFVEKQDSIGVLLSGGLDSCCIAYELLNLQKSNKLGDVKLNFYTINNEEDAPFVKILEDRFGIKAERLSYDMKTVDLKRALLINETPVDLGSMVPNQIMFELIPDKIVFTGDGPDEMFGGYRRIDQYDSQLSDVFEELPFYHFPRLNKAAKYFNKTLCCSYIDRSIVARALTLPLNERTHKKCLKDAYRGLIPDEIIDRKKLPLKNDELRNDPVKYRLKLVDEFKKIIS